MLLNWRARLGTTRSSRIVPERPKTRLLRIWRWPPPLGKSRRAPPHEPTGLPSTTSCCALKKSWARMRASRATRPSVRRKTWGEKQIMPATMRIASARILRRLLFVLFALALRVPTSLAQTEEPSSTVTQPPPLLLLSHQEIQFGKESERTRLQVAIKRACDHVNVPNPWVALEAITGSPEALS